HEGRQAHGDGEQRVVAEHDVREHVVVPDPHELEQEHRDQARQHQGDREAREDPHLDRKSTRLNSSHVSTSYAVFCLKKKKKPPQSRSSSTPTTTPTTRCTLPSRPLRRSARGSFGAATSPW